MIGKWTFDTVKVRGGWRWKLVNRDGALVMTSKHIFPTEAAARMPAQYELLELRLAVLAN